jgi:hypothetical protein
LGNNGRLFPEHYATVAVRKSVNRLLAAWCIDPAGHSDNPDAVSDFQLPPRFIGHARHLRRSKAAAGRRTYAVTSNNLTDSCSGRRVNNIPHPWLKRKSFQRPYSEIQQFIALFGRKRFLTPY